MFTFRPAVGQLYDPTREALPEGASWRLSPPDGELPMSLREVRPAEVHSRPVPAEFALMNCPMCWSWAPVRHAVRGSRRLSMQWPEASG